MVKSCTGDSSLHTVHGLSANFPDTLLGLKISQLTGQESVRGTLCMPDCSSHLNPDSQYQEDSFIYSRPLPPGPNTELFLQHIC